MYDFINTNTVSKQHRMDQTYTPRAAYGYIYLAGATIMFGFLVIIAKLFWLQLYQHDYLNKKIESRISQTQTIDNKRGNITDRNGKILAKSLPIYRLIVDPFIYQNTRQNAQQLAQFTDLDAESIQQSVNQYANKRYLPLKKDLPPEIYQQFKASPITGVYAEKFYKRFYPYKEVAAHLVGYTNYQNRGQEGIEYAYQRNLGSVPGKERTIKNGVGKIISQPHIINPGKPGKDLQLSIDIDIQSIAYNQLKKAVDQYNAQSGSIVVLDLQKNELLAMTNYPSFNPNNRYRLNFEFTRNRALTDLFEPGSTLKPLILAAALEYDLFQLNSEINTHPGYMTVGDKIIKDHNNYGLLTLEEIVAKSSNVGITKVAMRLGQDKILSVYKRLGIGTQTGVNFPGEQQGYLPYHNLSGIELATLSYGYGINMTALQLANIYSVFANGGFWQPVSLIKSAATTQNNKIRNRVLTQQTTNQVLQVLQTVINEGTGKSAHSNTYTTAGKTGTAYKSSRGKYNQKKYTATFAGIAPATNPRIVAVVLIHEPAGDHFYGGQVAAPVFKSLVDATLPLLNLMPDRLVMTNKHANHSKHTNTHGYKLVKASAERR